MEQKGQGPGFSIDTAMLLYLNLTFYATAAVFIASATYASGAMFIENPQTLTSPLKAATRAAAKSPAIAYSHGEPTAEAQYLLELINRARRDPPLEAQRLIDTDDEDIRQALAAFHVDPDRIIDTFSSYEPQPPLAFNADLITAADIHARDMKENDFQNHIGSDGSSLQDRLERAGYDYAIAGENIYGYAYSLDYGHAAFVIDWGVDELGHRNNLLNIDGRACFREIGIAVLADYDSNTEVGPLIIAEEFGRREQDVYVFVTGVAYVDDNDNGFYDPNEGLPGVAIMPDRGAYYAVTTSSGGFAIPVIPNSGIYQITVQPQYYPTVTAEILVESDNVKLDFPFAPLADQASVDPNHPPSSDRIDDQGLEPAGAACPLASFVVLSGIIALACAGDNNRS